MILKIRLKLAKLQNGIGSEIDINFLNLVSAGEGYLLLWRFPSKLSPASGSMVWYLGDRGGGHDPAWSDDHPHAPVRGSSSPSAFSFVDCGQSVEADGIS